MTITFEVLLRTEKYVVAYFWDESEAIASQPRPYEWHPLPIKEPQQPSSQIKRKVVPNNSQK
jgi:hypothetical protein